MIRYISILVAVFGIAACSSGSGGTSQNSGSSSGSNQNTADANSSAQQLSSSGTTIQPKTIQPFSLTIDKESTVFSFSSLLDDASGLAAGLDPSPPQLKVTGNYKGVKTGQKIYIGVVPTVDIFKDDIDIYESNGRFILTLEPVNDIFPGTYVGDLNVVTCADVLCNAIIGDGLYVVPFELTYAPKTWTIEVPGFQALTHQFEPGYELVIHADQDENKQVFVKQYIPSTVSQVILPEQMISGFQVTDITSEGFVMVPPTQDWGDVSFEYEIKLIRESGESSVPLNISLDIYPADFDKTALSVKQEDLQAIQQNYQKTFFHSVQVYNPYDEPLRAIVDERGFCVFSYRYIFSGTDSTVAPSGFSTLVARADPSGFADHTCTVSLSKGGQVVHQFEVQLKAKSLFN